VHVVVVNFVQNEMFDDFINEVCAQENCESKCNVRVSAPFIGI